MAGQRKSPARKAPTGKKEIRLFPVPPKSFDPFTATKRDLMKFGLPLRPDPHKEPGAAALWERQAARYRGFEHLEPRPDTTTANKKGLPAKFPAGPPLALGPDPIESCGYQLFSPSSAPFTALFVTWTVPDLHFSPGQFDPINHFHTFVGLGFLDVHVEMTVDSAQNVTSEIWAQGVGNVNLPVRPGDVISGALCLTDRRQGGLLLRERDHRAVDQLRGRHRLSPCRHDQRGRDSHRRHRPASFLPSAGELRRRLLRRDQRLHDGWKPVAHVGRRHHHGEPNGKILARPVRLNDFAFKAVFSASL